MPNGKMHKKPPRKLSNYKKAVKLEEGLTLARNRADNKWKSSKKGIMRSIQDHIGKTIDKIDPLKAGAIAGLTWFFYHSIPSIIASTIGISENDIKNEAAKLALSYVAAYLVITFFGKFLEAGVALAGDFTDIIKWLIIGKAIGGTGSGSIFFWSAPTSFLGFVTLVPTSPPETWGQLHPKFRSTASKT